MAQIKSLYESESNFHVHIAPQASLDLLRSSILRSVFFPFLSSRPTPPLIHPLVRLFSLPVVPPYPSAHPPDKATQPGCGIALLPPARSGGPPPTRDPSPSPGTERRASAADPRPLPFSGTGRGAPPCPVPCAGRRGYNLSPHILPHPGAATAHGRAVLPVSPGGGTLHVFAGLGLHAGPAAAARGRPARPPAGGLPRAPELRLGPCPLAVPVSWRRGPHDVSPGPGLARLDRGLGVTSVGSGPDPEQAAGAPAAWLLGPGRPLLVLGSRSLLWPSLARRGRGGCIPSLQRLGPVSRWAGVESTPQPGQAVHTQPAGRLRRGRARRLRGPLAAQLRLMSWAYQGSLCLYLSYLAAWLALSPALWPERRAPAWRAVLVAELAVLLALLELLLSAGQLWHYHWAQAAARRARASSRAAAAADTD
eukprot:g75623.t1